MNKFSFDRLGFRIDGMDSYLVSGEFHYFRVPRADWARRMQLFKDAGGNCLATYVPWLIHEPKEGEIVFGDVDGRDLCGFLDLAKQLDLKVILRPGPYQYSELVNAGLPEWLLDDYPEIMARDIEGNVFNDFSISYLHPLLLEKARRYFHAFAAQVKPYMMENGGPVCMLQVDNELIGIHVWFGSLDYNRDTMGFGKPDGRYPQFLRAEYETVERLNRAYGTAYSDFADAFPSVPTDRKDMGSCRRTRDYHRFYLSTIAEYALMLRRWLREDGLNERVCHNSASPTMNSLFAGVAQQMGDGFLLGSDHYYTLNANWAQNSPTPQYALRALMSLDMLRLMGMPPSVLELPGGSPSDTPPILPEDLLACYMCNLALGMKGLNYYVYTGGPNFPDTGTTCDLYDYNAHVRADGSLNETYKALQAFGAFMRQNGWMQRASRATSVQVGFEWETLHCDDYDPDTLPFNGRKAARFLERGMLYTLMCSAYAPEMVELSGPLNTERPLVIPCASVMSLSAQQNVIRFIESGGRVMIAPVAPEWSPEYETAAPLAEYLGISSLKVPVRAGQAVRVEGVGRVFNIKQIAFVDAVPEGAAILARDDRYGSILGFEKQCGAGSAIWFGGSWDMSTFDQVRMMESLVERMGGRPCVESSNRSLFTALWQSGADAMLFVMNLYSGAQSTHITVHACDGREMDLKLKPMEVRSIRL